MRWLTRIIFPLLLSFTFSSCAGITVQVVDENHTHVENAQVTFSFHNYPQDDKIQTVTDQNGIAQVKKKGNRRISITAEKTGYYYSEKVIEFKNNLVAESGHNNIYEIVLRKKRNPVPMYVKSIHSIEFPALNMPVGFDLEVGDWVEPYGKGKINDFVFFIKSHQTEWSIYDCSYTLTFTNEFDGIQEYQTGSRGKSFYKWPYLAPVDGYKKEINNTKSDSKKTGYQTSERKDINYIYRVRTKVDEKGNIVDARYGKILGEIRLFPKVLQFTYYFNPDGTTNLEYDLGQNLFKFSRRERFNYKVLWP